MTSVGTARERSRSACYQSKREPARSRDGLDPGVDDGLEVRVRLERRRLPGTAAAREVAPASSALRSSPCCRTARRRRGRTRTRARTPSTTNAPARSSRSRRRPREQDPWGPAEVGRKQVDSSHLAWLIGAPLDRLEDLCGVFAPQRPMPRSSALLGEGIEVPVDDRVAGEQADDAAEREERPERDRRLAAGLDAPRGR